MLHICVGCLFAFHVRVDKHATDDIIQGAAGPDEFRTTPLWGVGQRLFFLHDGRTSDLLDAINEHFSQPTDTYPASEANAVINNFLSLSKDNKQAILDYLRSL